jgi:O-antigen ligase
LKKLYPYIALIPIVGFCLIPPINVGLEAPGQGVTTWLILVTAFFGIYTLFLKTHGFIKVIAVAGFINCFFSSAPYLSFIAYISLIACCYFFILCTEIENWTPVFRSLQAILLLNVVLIIMQLTGNDKLLNFGLPTINCYGTIGSNNQIGGLVNSLSAFLVLINPVNFIFPLATGIITKSMGTFLAGAVGISVWLLARMGKRALIVIAILAVFFIVSGKQQGDFVNGSGRTPVWKKTVELSNRRPITGWGMGSYKCIMNAFMPTFRMAHNSMLQVLFEFGYLGFIFISILFGVLIYRLIKAGEIMCLSGLSMIAVDSMVHFPERQIQVVLILIAFMAFCVQRLNSKTTKGRGIRYG